MKIRRGSSSFAERGIRRGGPSSIVMRGLRYNADSCKAKKYEDVNMPDGIDGGKGPPILMLGSQMAIGGSQQILLRQSTWFHQHGYSVTVAFLYDKENLLGIWRAKYPFPIHDLGFARPGSGLFAQLGCFLMGWFRLFRLMRLMRFLAIETFTAHANLIGLPAAWIAGIPNRVGSHRGKIERFPHALQRINAILINSAITTSLAAVSERVRQEAISEGIRPERIVKIVNGVDRLKVDQVEVVRVRAELGVRDDNILLLSVGRLMYQKGHTILLKALPAVLSKYPGVLTVIAGGGPLLEDLRAEADQLSISRHVQFLGARDDVPTLMSAADIFLLPSRFEGMPNSVLEAMGQGLAVIAADVQGVDELIRDDQNGIIVPVNDPSAVGHAILRLLKDPAERERLGKAAQATIENNYTVDQMCLKYEKLLTAKQGRSS